MGRTYACIGSRQTPQPILDIQFRIGRVMCDLGWRGFSGEAPGSDKRYHDGARSSPRYREVGFCAIIPWGGFEGVWHDPSRNIYDLRQTDCYRRAHWLGLGARGTTAGLKQGGMLLHARNACQILDLDLCHPVKFVSCWAEPIGKKGKVKGGTGTAVALALHFGIDVINLATAEGLERALAFLEKHEGVTEHVSTKTLHTDS